MAGQIGLLSATQLQKLAQEQLTSGSCMRNARQASDVDDDSSWEVRAFAEDTANILGATWPPHSYTCSFCRREFKSAQALGGHMNVHRRDRARLQQIQSGAAIHPSPSSLLFPTDESVAGSGLCLFYPFPTPGSVSSPTPITPGEGFLDYPSSTLLPLSPYPLLPRSPSSSASVSGALVHHLKNNGNDDDDEDEEELDLELRLGQRPLN